jgi:exosortase B
MKRLTIGPAELPWWIALGGFAAMYVPLYWWAAFSEYALWQNEDHAHGALVLLVLIWLFWGMRAGIFAAPTRPARGLGWTLFAIGLLLYVIGRVIGIAIFMFGSQPFIVASILLLLRGPDAIRIAWFALFYFIFMIPLPGIFVDTVTGPLKQWISAIVVELLYHLGYPIARSGVMIFVGPYQLEVANACSGLHSMYSLSALGTLFMYIMGRKSVLHNAVMLASILPIAFAANIVRVIVLVLITYHLSAEAGEGFLHGAAGIVLMLVALLLFFALDALLERVLRPRSTPAPLPASVNASRAGLTRMSTPRQQGSRMQTKSAASILAALMCGAAIAAFAGIPTKKFPPIDLQNSVPDRFGGWSSVEESVRVVDPEVTGGIERIYNEVLTRTYVNQNRDRVMLSMAWGDDQRGERQVHRPDICYPAQGFDVETTSDDTLATPFGDISVRRLTTSAGSRHEPVAYWVAMASDVVRNDYDKRIVQLRLVRTGHIPDGLLFRVSSIDRDPVHAFKVQQQFTADMMKAVPGDVRQRLSGLKPASTD